ncbi:hypothetical protein TanjilG_12763 [Lupinus angustifolius]|uniref:RING-type E3 ubiquitin transferase n=1 Tax=Lupinus angustifolius TaxID=3871 RepID=A0A1J7H8G6_LUPAN|nr:hypothetical protein TanjilG_12763 [Lupinus angustifolius]
MAPNLSIKDIYLECDGGWEFRVLLRWKDNNVILGWGSAVPNHISNHVHDENSGEVTDVKYQKEAHVKEIGGECPVCLSVFADGEEIRQLSVCKHSFHASCIDMWLSNHSNCPICRANIAAVTKLSGSNSSAAPTRDGDLQHGGDASALI